METGFVIENGILTKYEGSDAVVTIPDGVVKIGEHTFENNKNITDIVMPDSIVSIGQNAFEGCIKLKSVIFSKNIKTIEYCAFLDCKALKELCLPDTLETVESGAFAGCVKLSKITCDSKVFKSGANPFSHFDTPECKKLFDKNGFLVFANVLYQYNGDDKIISVPEGVTEIACGAFHRSGFGAEKSQLKKIVLPDSVKRICNFAFASCTKLKEIVLPDEAEIADSAFRGCSGLADENGLVIFGNKAYEYLGKNTVVEIPKGIEILSEELFKVDYEFNPVNKKITKIVLPEGLKHIGSNAFNGCVSLTEINIPESVEIIGKGAFCRCEGLKNIKVPETAEMLDGAFLGCKNLADENGFIAVNGYLFQCISDAAEITIPDSIKRIGSYAFSGLNIKKIILPESLERLGSAFEECVWLEEIDIPEGIEKICRSTFQGCYELKKINLPEKLSSIDDFAFESCKKLEEIIIPENVISIGEYAFEECISLKVISFPKGIKEIPHSACSNCSALEKINISEGTETIEKLAFSGCLAIEELVLPQSIKKIDYAAFKDCSALKNVVIQNPDCSVDLFAFDGCPKLTDENGMKIITGELVKYSGNGGKVEIPETVREIGPNAFREGVEMLFRRVIEYRPAGSLEEIIIPSSVKTISDSAFKGCTELKKIVVPEGVENIYANAFAGCKNLESVELPSTLKFIGTKAFEGCYKLASVVIPKNVENLGIDVFRNCQNLTDIFVEEGNRKYSSSDGIIYSADKNELVYCPAGKKFKIFAVSETVYSVADHAFFDCEQLQKITIPASVKKIGNEVFARNVWSGVSDIKYPEIAVGAGSESVGENVIGFGNSDKPLVYPKIPVTFPKEQTVQIRLCLGFCLNPEKYEEEYAAEYRKFAQSHQRTLLKKAAEQKFEKVEEYFASDVSVETAAKTNGFKPDLSAKKPNELRKVEILEEATLKGTVEDLKAVLETYKTFEMTARALGLACRYRGADFVRELMAHGASFKYESDPNIQRKYAPDQKTAAGNYTTKYYLMLVPKKIDFDNYGIYNYSPMCGFPYMGISEEQEAKVLPLNERIEVAKFLLTKKKGVSMDEMLFWALVKNELGFADALIEMGVTLGEKCPDYYGNYHQTYLDIITNSSQIVYRASFISELSKLEEKDLLPVLKKFNALTSAAGKKIMMSQKMFDDLKWNDESLAFAIENFDTSKVNQKKALESAVLKNYVSAVEKMAEAGWINQPAKRESLIDLARDNNCHEILAWLLDYKNRTVDIAVEEAKAEAKIMKELTEDPNSVSALKKVWGYKKLDNGTLQITSYKGSDTEVVIPSQIGKNPVSVIGEEAFSASSWSSHVKNREERKKIKNIVIPEGVTEIQRDVFWECSELEKIVFPSTVKKIHTPLAVDCKKLIDANIPIGAKIEGNSLVFMRCEAMHDENGCVICSGRLVCHTQNNGYAFGSGGNVVVPEGVTEIAPNVFKNSRIESLKLPETLKIIGENAFEDCFHLTDFVMPEGLETIKKAAFMGCSSLKNIKIGKNVKNVGADAFRGCRNLKDLYIPKSVKKIGKEILGVYDENANFGKVSGICVHTHEGSTAVEYMKKYSGVMVVFDYDE